MNWREFLFSFQGRLSRRSYWLFVLLTLPFLAIAMLIDRGSGNAPLEGPGALLALLATGYTLSFTSIIGMIALIGIEIKNSILLVDFTNRLRAQGMPLDQAIQEAGEVRFLPILLTSATAIGGLLPLALQGSGLYSPLAIVIIGGLISSTLLARLVTPVMYKLLPPRAASSVAVDAPMRVLIGDPRST